MPDAAEYDQKTQENGWGWNSFHGLTSEVLMGRENQTEVNPHPSGYWIPADDII
jgi:hypothetical protein